MASRIDDLRRRVEADPASIAFAQLAEEYRRAGQSEEAVHVCRDGLTRHPAYLSARVTLGRALLDLGEFAEARAELEFVVHEAPENLAALRGLAEIFHKEGALPDALDYYQRALMLARHDPELEEIVQQLSRQVGADAAPSNGLSFEEAHQELLSAAERVPLVAPSPAPADASPGTTAPFDFDKLVAALGSPSGPPPPGPPIEALLPPEAPPAIDGAEPGLTGDPFAALEAELRSRDAAAEDLNVGAIVAEEAAHLADGPHAAAPLALAAPPDAEHAPDAEHTQPSADTVSPTIVLAEAAVVETFPEAEAVAVVAEDATALEPPPIPEPTVEDAPALVVDEVPSFIEVAEPSAAEPLPWQDPDPAPESRPWPWEPVTMIEDATPEFYRAAEMSATPEILESAADADAAVAAMTDAAETPVDTATAGEVAPTHDAGPVALAEPFEGGVMAEHESTQHDEPSAPDTDTETAVEVAAVEQVTTASAEVDAPVPLVPAPAPADEDVLEDLEGWLDTLQARSSQ